MILPEDCRLGVLLGNGLIGYVIFSLAAAINGLLILADRLTSRLRAYITALCFFAAIVLITVYSPVNIWVSIIALFFAAIRPIKWSNRL